MEESETAACTMTLPYTFYNIPTSFLHNTNLGSIICDVFSLFVYSASATTSSYTHAHSNII